jgi:septal ring factor EnvC (AmiA/AmiB activator)
VFADDYKLKPLEEVEQLIKQNKHLPNIPAASVVEKEGFDLGDMNKRLLEKVEELTLYLIEMKKENKNLQQTNQTLEQRLNKIEKKLEERN